MKKIVLNFLINAAAVTTAILIAQYFGLIK